MNNEDITSLSKDQFVFNGEIITLRSYQANAIDKLLEQYKKGENGYAWHCSNSGNSLSAYGLAKRFEELPEVDKVILITSKRDMLFKKDQFSMPFKKFIKDFSSKKLILVSSSNFNFAIKNKAGELKKFKDLNCIFIIDDCMLTLNSDKIPTLNRVFGNPKLYGFMAPPDFGQKSGYNRRIKTYFKNKVSQYLLNDAIEENYLSSVDIEFVGNDNLDDVFLSKDILASDDRIERISKWIIENHADKTDNKKYSAILFAPSASSVLKYYDILRENTDLKIGAIFKYFDGFKKMNNDEIETKFKEIINYYEKELNLDSNLNKNSFRKYRSDVIECFNEGKFDLLITDFNGLKYNSKYNNTLYWDYGTASSRLYPISKVNKKLDDNKEGNVIIFTDFEEKSPSNGKNNLFESNISYKLNDIDNLEDLSKISGIYLLIYGGEVIYVGQSNNLKLRLKQHWEADINKILDEIKKEDGMFNLTKLLALYLLIEDNLEDIEFEVIQCPKSELNIKEKMLIEKYKPRYNIEGVSKPFRDVI